MKELEVRKMSPREIAEWFGITYGALRNDMDKYCKILEDYAEFKRIPYKGFFISKVKVPIYIKGRNENRVDLVKYSLKEAAEHKDGFSSSAGMARKIIDEEGLDFDANYNNLKRGLQAAEKHNFGEYLEKKGDRIKGETDGVYGYRYAEWAILQSYNNKYRWLTADEWELYNKIKQEVYQENIEKVDATILAAYDKEMGYISEEEQDKRNKKNNIYPIIMQRFKQRTKGKILVRLGSHILNEEGMKIVKKIKEEGGEK